ncbi:hypothetical protein [Peptoniphilus catoniae]|uniref:hypothetical protein n=1 Tax=Peptoniphilus catoniae TaxID=1660341 RepID=UPI0010FE97D0|nr:hypothetical protein [Peptoniphilus catoniae]
MARKKKKITIKEKLERMNLTEEEKTLAERKALVNILMCILWPLTLFILWADAKEKLGVFYYLIILISFINVILTYYYTKLDIDKDKFLSHMLKSKIGKVERFGTVFLVVEIVLILSYIFILNK